MAEKKKATGIKSWPEDDRPREKLLKKGAGALSNSELLAILLRTGTHGTSAIDLARKVLKKFGSFRNMSHVDERDWKGFKGLGMAKIAQLKSALEIGRRFREVGEDDTIRIDLDGSLKHNFHRSIKSEDIYIYCGLEKGKKAELHYECHADNLPSPIKGKLTIVAE